MTRARVGGSPKPSRFLACGCEFSWGWMWDSKLSERSWPQRKSLECLSRVIAEFVSRCRQPSETRIKTSKALRIIEPQPPVVISQQLPLKEKRRQHDFLSGWYHATSLGMNERMILGRRVRFARPWAYKVFLHLRTNPRRLRPRLKCWRCAPFSRQARRGKRWKYLLSWNCASAWSSKNRYLDCCFRLKSFL